MTRLACAASGCHSTSGTTGSAPAAWALRLQRIRAKLGSTPAGKRFRPRIIINPLLRPGVTVSLAKRLALASGKFVGPKDHGTTRPRDYKTTGLQDHGTTRPQDHRTTRPQDHQT